MTWSWNVATSNYTCKLTTLYEIWLMWLVVLSTLVLIRLECLDLRRHSHQHTVWRLLGPCWLLEVYEAKSCVVCGGLSMCSCIGQGTIISLQHFLQKVSSCPWVRFKIFCQKYQLLPSVAWFWFKIMQSLIVHAYKVFYMYEFSLCRCIECLFCLCSVFGSCSLVCGTAFQLVSLDIWLRSISIHNLKVMNRMLQWAC